MDPPINLHPVFGFSKIYIPALELCQPLTMQLLTYPTKFEDNIAYEKSLKANYLTIGDFQSLNLLKSTIPTMIYNGFDLKNSTAVTLLKYRTVGVNDVSDLVRETSILRSLKHKNLLAFYHTVYGQTIGSIYLAFEPFECFLSQLICEENALVYEPPLVKCIMQQIFKGLNYLHEKDIVHRDITPKNLVVTEIGTLKISNFRSARRIGQRGDRILTLEYGYQPVDMLLGSETFTWAVDVWSASCIFAELLLKRRLFKSPDKKGILNEVFALLGFPSQHIWPEFFQLPDYKYLEVKKSHQFNCLRKIFKKENEKSNDLLRKGLIYSPNYRASSEECKQHPYFTEVPPACSPKQFFLMFDQKTFIFPVEYSV